MKLKTIKEPAGHESGECYEHNIRWWNGGIECPLCVSEQTLRAVKADRPSVHSDNVWKMINEALDILKSVRENI